MRISNNGCAEEFTAIAVSDTAPSAIIAPVVVVGRIAGVVTKSQLDVVEVVSVVAAAAAAVIAVAAAVTVVTVAVVAAIVAAVAAAAKADVVDVDVVMDSSAIVGAWVVIVDVAAGVVSIVSMPLYLAMIKSQGGRVGTTLHIQVTARER